MYICLKVKYLTSKEGFILKRRCVSCQAKRTFLYNFFVTCIADENPPTLKLKLNLRKQKSVVVSVFS